MSTKNVGIKCLQKYQQKCPQKMSTITVYNKCLQNVAIKCCQIRFSNYFDKKCWQKMLTKIRDSTRSKWWTVGIYNDIKS